MDDKRILYQQPIIPLQQRAGSGLKKNASAVSGEFGQILDNKLANLQFSQHAQQRLRIRNIKLSDEQMNKLSGAVDRAAAKGAKETLVLMENKLAFLVGVKNRTVITAVDGENMKENVFTNIDSAVIV